MLASFIGGVATNQRPISQSDVTTTTKIIVQQVTESEYHSARYVWQSSIGAVKIDITRATKMLADRV